MKNPGKQHILFIVNTKAGRKNNGAGFLGKLKRLAKQSIHDIKIEETKYPGHANDIAKEHLKTAYSIFVAVGGDGTVNEVGSAIINTDKTLAVLPLGSGNGFSHQVNKGKNAKKILDAILSGFYEVHQIDTACVNSRPFLNIAGIGFDGYISELFAKSKARGFLTYFGLVVRQFLNYKSANYTIQTDDMTFDGKYFMVAFANSSEYGNHFTISPNSKLSDGALEVCMVIPPKLYQLPALVFSLIFKRKGINSVVHCKSFKRCEVKVVDKMPMHVDGDYFCYETSCTIEVNQLSLSVLVAS